MFERLGIWPHHERLSSTLGTRGAKGTDKLPPFNNPSGFICLFLQLRPCSWIAVPLPNLHLVASYDMLEGAMELVLLRGR